MERVGAGLRRVAALVSVVSPLLSHAAIATGRGEGVAVVLAAVQAVALGPLLWPRLPGWAKLAAVAGPGLLCAGLAAGVARSAATGLLVVAGLDHALLYGALLAVFGLSLRRGHTDVVTRVAARLNKRFRAGMIPYTRAVTTVWCGFFAAQLAASAVLLAAAPVEWWLLLVATLHGPMAAVLALGEFAVRCRRFPGEHVGWRDLLRGAAGRRG